MWTKSHSLLLSRILIWLFIVVLILGFIATPHLLAISSNSYIDPTNLGLGASIFALVLRITVLPALAALVLMNILLKNIQTEQVFTTKNISLIRYVSWCCHLVALIFLVLGFSYLHLSTLVISAIIGFCGLVLRVVKNVFAQAQEIKDENDLTV